MSDQRFNAERDSIYDEWTEIDEELSYGEKAVMERGGYTIAHKDRGWANVYNPRDTHKYALYLPDGKLLRTKAGTITVFVDVYNAVKRANRTIYVRNRDDNIHKQ